MARPSRTEPSTSPEPLAPTPEFLRALADIGVELEPGDDQRLGCYLALLLDANTRFNLTAITDPAEAWTRHILDSLTLVALLSDLPAGARVLDVGSGGGLPGVPLAIVMPTLRFTLLEATGKKADFLSACVTRLRLANVGVVQARAESAAQDRGNRLDARAGALRESFDAVLCRAVGRVAVVAELCVPFARVGGLVVLVKGQKAPEELEEATKALELLRASHAGTVETPTGRLVVLEKTAPTPRTYPRRDGEPRRAPLGIRRERASDAGDDE